MTNETVNSITNLSAPITVWWDVTSKCNLNCLHCYSSSSASKSNTDELTNTEARALISELSEMNVFGIYFLGGEPFMRPDLLDLVKCAMEKRIGVTISSNGWLITEAISDELRSLGVSQVRISIDGALPNTHDWQRNKQGSFEHAVNAVRNLVKSGVHHVSIVSTISRRNASEIADIIDLAAKLRVHAIQILVVTQSGRGKDNYENLSVTEEQAILLKRTLEQKQKQYYGKLLVYSNDGLLPGPCNECIVDGSVRPDFVGCQAGRTRCNIDYNGNVVPCLLVREPVAGNVRETSFGEIWKHSPTFLEWRKRHLYYQECLECDLNDVCQRECPLSESQTKVTSLMRKKRMASLNGRWEKNVTPCLINEACKSVSR